MQITPGMVTGSSELHLVELPECHTWIHSEVADPWRSLQLAARTEGFELQIASCFRSFERQLMIWNAKALGKRPVFDDNGRPLDLRQLDDRNKVMAILRWSALPGASRHHWGTDMDVWDSAAVPKDYSLRLSPDEYRWGGPFSPLCEWLDSSLEKYGFYRPYEIDSEGVAPEPWHLSYRQVARQFESQISRQLLLETLEASELELKHAVLGNLDEIMDRFILCAD
ncbi:MAG: M15 family metallopeptidase [Pseudomonadales bacterium]|nr:M15 family metallopeptidase [Pseudomonadales bacterium]